MIYKLSEQLSFPPVDHSEDDGLLAFDGDLSRDRLLLAYRSGIFPWYSEDPIMWWSPDPRFVAFPESVKFSRSMKKVLKSKEFDIRVDTAFKEVMLACSRVPRSGQDGTWITDEMIEAYCNLHEEGYAHSFEAWQQGELVGGLYGLSMGSIFFGESMFSHVSNSSKAAFLSMVIFVRKLGFSLIDSQVHTPHLESLGAEHISRAVYLKLLQTGLKVSDRKLKWSGLYNSVTSSSTT